jgi:hypothetical protein
MPQPKKPTNKQLEKLVLKMQSLFGIKDNTIHSFDEIMQMGNPFHFFESDPLYKSIFIEDKGITLIHTLNSAIVRRNFCNTVFSSHTSSGESAPYYLIGSAIDILKKYECNTFKDVWEKENSFEYQERVIINALITWVTTLTYPQFECGVIGKTDAENNNSVSRLVLNFNCTTTGYDAFFNNQKDLTKHEYYNEFIKLLRVKSFNFNDEKLDKIISDNEETAYNLIKSSIEDNGGKLDTDIAIYALKLENTQEDDGVFNESMALPEIPELPTY